MKKTILITGGTGFIGSHLAKTLFEGGYKILILKRATSTKARLDKFGISNSLEYYDAENLHLDHIFKMNQIDAVVHLATEYGRNGGDKSSVYNANFELPIRLFDLAVQYQVPKFINTDTYFSKFEGYGHLNDYSRSKKIFLEYLVKNSSQIEINNLRLEHVYGQWDSNTKFVEMLFQNIAVNPAEEVRLTSGEQKRDFIYIDDVVEAFIAVIRSKQSDAHWFKNYEVGTGQSIAVKEFVEQIKAQSKSKTKLLFGHIAQRQDEVMESCASIDALLGIGWRPTIGIQKGISLVLKEYKNKIV